MSIVLLAVGGWFTMTLLWVGCGEYDLDEGTPRYDVCTRAGDVGHLLWWVLALLPAGVLAALQVPARRFLSLKASFLLVTGAAATVYAILLELVVHHG